ncbi:MAG: PilZ domain-containing protein [Armatimonadetes bacterium]|nr:PilZ domain-containing protein [Armatimonadota bacterium]
MSQESAEERRRYFRINKVMPAHFELLNEDGTVVPGPPPPEPEPGEEPMPPAKERLFVVDISAGGFRATTHRQMPNGSRLRTEIYIQRNKPVTAECRVVWQRELSIPGMYEVGFEFSDIPQTEWKRLVDFIVEERSLASRSQPVTWQIEKGYLNRPIGGL